MSGLFRGQHRIGESSGWFWGGSIFWFRVFGYGLYRVRCERPYLLRPGRRPKRNAGMLR